MKTLIVTKNKSFSWSFGVHAGLLLIALLPFAQKAVEKEPVEYLLDISYLDLPEIQPSGSSGLQARSPVFNEEPQPTTDSPAEDPVPVEETKIEEVIKVAENNSDIVTDVTTESEVDVTASEGNDNGADAESQGHGGGSGSPIPGDQNGAAHAGNGGGGDGLEGDGIITRRVIYRENIASVAKENGRITLNICIDRQGKVVYAGYDPDKTTITDKEIIKQATYLALRYRYETKYNAPLKECGQLTFIFRIDKPIVDVE
jgi:hypothetical protein